MNFDFPSYILISRTDSIGDVVLTIPLAGFLKRRYPDCKIGFLGKQYTQAVIDMSENIDEFHNWTTLEQMPNDELVNYFKNVGADWIIHVFPNKRIAQIAKKAGVPLRLGTSHRAFHWATCNKLSHFSRKKSDLHEAQLNFKLVAGVTGGYLPKLADIPELYGFTRPLQRNWIRHLVDDHKYNVILHPKSQGSAREWGLENYSALIRILPPDRYNIFITGTREEAKEVADFLEEHRERVKDVTAQFTLEELIAFISYADGLVAASTGPLHIAAALGKKAVGIFAPMKPIHPGRWMPLGVKARTLVLEKKCSDCRKTGDCMCIRSIRPGQVLAALEH